MPFSTDALQTLTQKIAAVKEAHNHDTSIQDELNLLQQIMNIMHHLDPSLKKAAGRYKSLTELAHEWAQKLNPSEQKAFKQAKTQVVMADLKYLIDATKNDHKRQERNQLLVIGVTNSLFILGIPTLLLLVKFAIITSAVAIPLAITVMMVMLFSRGAGALWWKSYQSSIDTFQAAYRELEKISDNNQKKLETMAQSQPSDRMVQTPEPVPHHDRVVEGIVLNTTPYSSASYSPTDTSARPPR